MPSRTCRPADAPLGAASDLGAAVSAPGSVAKPRRAQASAPHGTGTLGPKPPSPPSPATDALQRDFTDWISATRDPAELVLGVEGFCYADLFDPHRLAQLSREFDRYFEQQAPDAYGVFATYRETRGKGMSPEAVSDTLVEAAPVLSRFVAKLFRIESEWEGLLARTKSGEAIWTFQRTFVKTRFARHADERFAHGLEVAADIARDALLALGAPESEIGTGSEAEELAFAKATLALQEIEDVALRVLRAGGAVWTEELQARAARVHAALAPHLARSSNGAPRRGAETPSRDDPLEPTTRAALQQSAAAATLALDALGAWLARRVRDAHSPVAAWPSLRAPAVRKPTELIQIRRPDPQLPELLVGPGEGQRPRDGFGHTDAPASARAIDREVHYCVLCHDRDKDSCSKGLRDAKQGGYKKNALGVELTGCPLHERISEMHTMRRAGDSLAALALVCIDNPMLAGTGHRICNDCMRACVFQKQEPVDIPRVETAVLRDVLSLPWGFEVYGLLSRWNPLDARRPEPRPYAGKNVLIVGLGPAGYTLAHHLAREGFGVVAIDALRLEPLPAELTGLGRSSPRPIYRFSDLTIPLDERLVLGFGGVSEYGITVRWDKNFLSALFLMLSREPLIRMHGSVRFGGTLTLEDAWEMGFDHVAMAAGSGRPTMIGMKNDLARGVRQASDFLMALQLSGAYKRSAMANLQVRLPALVIGGGLTAVDTATELLAYYAIQAEKTAARLDVLEAEMGRDAVRKLFDTEEWAFLQEQRAHAAALAQERADARRERRRPDFRPLLDEWGGVSLVYRKAITDSPAYRLNHEEVAKCLEEGVKFAECLAPVEVLLDEHEAVRAVRFERTRNVEGAWRSTGDGVDLKARTVCVAAGTSPNVTYAKERSGSFELDARGQFFKAHHAVRNDDGTVRVEPASDPSRAFFTSYCDGRHTVSYYGDNHPHYAGSVVKAMASAKDGFLHIAELLDAATEASDATRPTTPAALFARCDDEFVVRVQEVRRLTDTILEVVLRAKAAARKFEPGQFYRLQNYEQTSHVVDGTRLAMEGIALTGAWVDKEQGWLSLIVLEMGTSSRLCALLRPGERVALMGPTGTPTEIPDQGTVLLCGGGLGNAVLFSIARALKSHGVRVLYFAGYRRGEDLFKREEIEAATDQVIWCTEDGAPIEPSRPQDRHVRGNLVEAMTRYGRKELGGELIALSEVGRIIAIGSDRMMAAVQKARHGVLAPMLDPRHVGIASINSPMQCMMKEVCAQCLQRHIDPATGRETVVFSCVNQDQPLDVVDFKHLSERLRSNTAQEKLANAWLDGLLAKHPELPRS